MVKEHSANYHPTRLRFTSRIHPSDILEIPLVLYYFPEFLLDFLSNLYIPPLLRIKFEVLKLLENIFVRQQVESKLFYSCLP